MSFLVGSYENSVFFLSDITKNIIEAKPAEIYVGVSRLIYVVQLFCIFLKKDLVAEIPSSKFKDIQKLIANKLENSMAKKDSVIETSTKITPTAATRSPGAGIANVQPKFYDCPSNLPPPPPPPLPPRRAAKAASTRKASPVVEMFQALTSNKGKNPSVGGNYSKQIASSAHNSIVGEIQNRSAHLLAVRI